MIRVPRGGPSPSGKVNRWVGVGTAGPATSDPFEAASHAVAAAMQGDDPKLLVVFASDAVGPNALLAAMAAVAPDVPLVGCSTAGEIAAAGPGDAGVVVMALGGSGFEVATEAASMAAGIREAGETVARCASKVDGAAHRVLLLLSDGLACDQQEVVRGAYGVVGAEVPMVGGCAGDDLKMVSTLQFHGGDVLSRAVVAAAIGSDAPLGIGVHHGWKRVGDPMLVSASDGNRVLSLDDEPALDVYLRGLGAPVEARTDPHAFTHFAITHPLGLQRRSGEEVRFVAGADFADRSLTCVAHLPQGGLTWFMEGDAESVLSATDAACDGAVEQLGGSPPIGLLAFDCISRRGVLGQSGIADEVTRIAGHADGAPVAGFYTYGEIARTGGVGGFYNQTLVVLALA